MKKVFFIATCMLTLLTACTKDDDNPEKDPGNFQTPLPEATQTGVGMFACYVDGKAYIAKGNNVTAFYQYYMGEYGLTVRGDWKNTGNDYIWAIALESSSVETFIQGHTYDLTELITTTDTYYGTVFFKDISKWLYTNNEHVGKLTITKIDHVKQILSGTFWYDVKRPDGTIVHIRDGRFDVNYAN